MVKGIPRGFFTQGDDQIFVATVAEYLQKGAARLHHVSEQKYVQRCRVLWQNCETDPVFKFKLLIDKLVLDQQEHEFPFPPVFEDVSRPQEPREDLYCVAIGLMFPDGSFVDAPAGHKPAPEKPGAHRAVFLALPDKIPVEEPENLAPSLYVVALFDVLGFSNKLRAHGLEKMQILYQALIDIALKPFAAERQWTRMLTRIGADLYSPGMFWLPIRYAYFSDSILLWVPYRPEFVAAFLDRCLNVLCAAIRLELPLRGAIAAGEAIMHKKTNTYLGAPLVEADRLELWQEWIGVACGVSVRSESFRIPFHPEHVILFPPPFKEGLKQKGKRLCSGLVLDWPRRWREIHGSSSAEAVSQLRSQSRGYGNKYDNTLRFVEYSDSNPTWYTRLLAKESQAQQQPDVKDVVAMTRWYTRFVGQAYPKQNTS